MNDYITLDGKRYRCAADDWEPTEDRPMVIRRLMSGAANVTFGPATFMGWRGTVLVDVGAQAPFGTPAEFRTTFKKRSTLSFTDHSGAAHTVVIDRSVGQKSISPNWEASDNTLRFNLSLVKL